MTALLIALFPKKRFHPTTDDRFIFLLFLYLGTVIMWMVASFSLAKAKGYSSDETGAIFIFLFLLAFCFPVAAFLLPGVVIFGLKDKTRVRKW